MFRSKRNALIFAGLVVVGAVFAVGGEEDPGDVITASEDLAAQREALNREMESAERLGEDNTEDVNFEEEEDFEDDDSEYADDDALIDDAQGFDPSPEIETFEVDEARDGDFASEF